MEFRLNKLEVIFNCIKWSPVDDVESELRGL